MSFDDSEPERLVGTLVAGKYRIDALLGRGGMGAVYQATHQSIGKRVALKFLWRDSSRDPDTVIRFQREAEAASAVESAHIVQIFDSGISDEGLPFLVMEALTGEDLRTRLKREHRLPLAEAVHVAGQVARGLMRAHEAGIVHRDLKPDNIFLCRRDDDPMFVKIVDFGISKVSRGNASPTTLTRRGMVLGTAFYMSPEQAQAWRDVDGRTDLFSLGAILYEMLTGHPPHTGPAYEAVLIDICTKDAPDVRLLAPEVPEAVARVAAQALCRNREQRFQTAEAFYGALAAAVPGLLRTGSSPGAAVPRALEVGGPTTPSPLPGTPAEAMSRTSSGTALQAGSSVATAVQTRRTVVAALVAALGAFAVTAMIMARGAPPAAPHVSAPDPSQALPAEVPSAAEPLSAQPSASAGPIRSAPLATAARPRPTASAKDVRPIPPAAALVRAPPTKRQSFASPTGSAGVARGLKLVTEP